jgi:uncharacterized membrane protein YeaQ/YmgE (transglycosylase-associated protein family)
MSAGFIISLILLAAIIAAIWLTFNFIAVLITLAIAAVVGWLADKIVPGQLPYGWLGAMVAGLLGSWLGSLLFGRIGPVVGNLPIVSALLGAIILAFVVQFALKRGIAR